MIQKITIIPEDMVTKFIVPQQIISFEPFGKGHINDTYLATLTDGKKTRKYIFQRINTNVFKDVDILMNNVVAVTEYMRYKLRIFGKNPDQHTVTVIKTVDDKNYYRDENDICVRCQLYIDNVDTINNVTNPHDMFLSGKAFGQFQQYMDGFNAKVLDETIPNFHNTEDRLKKLKLAIRENRAERVDSCHDEIEFYLARENYATIILKLMEEGKIPTRVTHNDTKINNILLDLKNDEPIAVIDLDTVMPGTLLYDFGDSIRYGASTAAEDEIDLSKVNFSLDFYKAYANGFIMEVRERLTTCEVKYMHFGAILMTYECGMRFLTDYLNGDIYFKISRDNQNIDRARTHMKLISEMEKVIKEMQQIVINIVFDLE